MTYVIALLSGLLFALGLGISGMTQPSKVLAFLDLAGEWDPSLALVMAGAIAVYMPIYWRIARRGHGLTGAPLQIPAPAPADRALLLGAMLFGAGWGLSGFCPGPALVFMATMARPAIIFGVSMIAGMAVYTLYQRSTAHH